jgi:hypothetical protein
MRLFDQVIQTKGFLSVDAIFCFFWATLHKTGCLVDAPLGVLFDSPHRQHAALVVLLFATLLQCHL